MNIPKFRSLKNMRKLKMVTCYDASFAKALEKTDVDAVLVGDSVAMVVYGQESTVGATVDMIANHVRAVRTSFSGMIVADVPFLSTGKSQTDFIEDIQLLMRAGANAVKIEGVLGFENKIESLVQAGVPVMGHVGLTPQFVNEFGGFRVQGRDSKTEEKIMTDAKALDSLGCFSVVLECVPAPLAQKISESLSVPTIGIGAGVEADGQILVLHDMLGLTDQKFKFVKNFESFMDRTVLAVNSYCKDVEEEKFPLKENSFL